MSRRYRLVDVEEAIAELEELVDVADDIAETDEDMQLVISGWHVYVEALNLSMRQGIVCVWDEDAKMYMPDFDVTVVYEGNLSESSRENPDWLYFEQDGFVVTLGNWLNGRMSLGDLEQLWCELIIPEQNKEQKESEE